METLLSILTIIVAVIVIIKFITYIRDKYGIQASRKAYFVMLTCFIFHDIYMGNIFYACFLASIMVIAYFLGKAGDKANIGMYKMMQLQLSELIDKGYGEVYKANLLRGKMSRIWRFMPEQDKQKILEWEKTLDSSQKT